MNRDQLNHSEDQQRLLQSGNAAGGENNQRRRRLSSRVGGGVSGSYDNYNNGNDPQQQGQHQNRDLKDPPAHPQTLNHQEFLQNKIYNACYPLSAKIEQMFKSVFRQGNTAVEILDKARAISNREEIPEDRAFLQDKVLQLKINEISNQELDPNLAHPFVRVHIVDINTGIYIKKAKPETDVLVNHESITSFDEITKEYNSCKNDLIFPFATNCVDLKESGGARARWNETFLINDDCDNIIRKEVIILFEVLDFNPKALQSKDLNNLDQDNYYKVAWGYLRPLGLAKNHFGLSKIQLYKYVFDSQKFQAKQRKHYIPLVYFDFIWPNRTYYDGFLSIQLTPMERPSYKRVAEKSMNVFEIEVDENPFRSGFNNSKGRNIIPKDLEEEILDKEKIKGRRIRDPNKPCEIPDKRLIAKFISAELGCFRLSFSPNGKILAAACTNKKSETCIKLFDVDDNFQQIYQYRGHSNLIHCMNWIRTNQNFALLSTSSSDFTNKIWKIPHYSETDEFIDEDESEEQYLTSSIHHPSYVYCSQFYPLRKGGSGLILVTGCFDQQIRFWNINQDEIGQQLKCVHKILISDRYDSEGFETFENLLEHRHPNCIEFDSQSLMFVGDSLGLVHIFTVTTILDDPTLIRWQRTIRDPSLIGDPISQLHYIQQKKYLIVHSKNNCIRTLEIQQNVHLVAKSYIGAFSSKFPVHSCISPDQVWLLSGSEDGKPHLWHIEGGDQSDLKRLEYNIEGVVSDVSWNSTYHMIAIAGFGKDHPISLYVYEEDQDLTVGQYRDLKEKLDQQEKMRMQFDLDQGQQQDPYDPGNKVPRRNYGNYNY